MIIEWKTYQAADHQEEAMKQRFKTHTLRFLAKHGIKVLGVYSSPENAAMLYYLTQFETDEARKAAWSAFAADPEWQALRRETEASGPIVAQQSTILLTSELAI